MFDMKVKIYLDCNLNLKLANRYNLNKFQSWVITTINFDSIFRFLAHYRPVQSQIIFILLPLISIWLKHMKDENDPIDENLKKEQEI